MNYHQFKSGDWVRTPYGDIEQVVCQHGDNVFLADGRYWKAGRLQQVERAA